MDGSVRQASDEGRKGPQEALFEAPPRRPRSPRRSPIADRRAAAAAHHSPRAPGTGAGGRRPAAWNVLISRDPVERRPART